MMELSEEDKIWLKALIAVYLMYGSPSLSSMDFDIWANNFEKRLYAKI